MKKEVFVYTVFPLDLIDTCSGFFRKLKRFVGFYTITQTLQESFAGKIRASFLTDKIQLTEGQNNEVFLTAKDNEKGNWYFTDIKKY